MIFGLLSEAATAPTVPILSAFSFNFENDCIISSLTYSRDFYSDKDLKNTKTLIFGITIKPFADSLGPDLTEFIN